MGRDLSGSQSLMSATVQTNFVVKAVAGAPVTEVFHLFSMVTFHWTILVSRRVLENWAIVSVSSFNRFSFKFQSFQFSWQFGAGDGLCTWMWTWLKSNSYFISIVVLGFGMVLQDGCYVCELCLPDPHIFYRIHSLLNNANPSQAHTLPQIRRLMLRTFTWKLGAQKMSRNDLRLVVSDLQNYTLDWHY